MQCIKHRCVWGAEFPYNTNLVWIGLLEWKKVLILLLTINIPGSEAVFIWAILNAALKCLNVCSHTGHCYDYPSYLFSWCNFTISFFCMATFLIILQFSHSHRQFPSKFFFSLFLSIHFCRQQFTIKAPLMSHVFKRRWRESAMKEKYRRQKIGNC